MPSPSTFTVVPEAQAEDIKQAGSTRKAWLTAIRNGEVIVMQNRPSLTKPDKAMFDQLGLKMRTRYTNGNDENEAEVYVWAEQAQQPQTLAELQDVLREDDEAPLPDEDDEQVPL